MLDDIEIEVRVLIYELMMVMYRHDIREVHVGGIMRMLGVANETAQTHDDEMVVLDDQFAKYVEQMYHARLPDQILH